MPNFAIMRINKLKIGSVTPINNHHERLKEKYKSNPDIDPQRTHLNYHLVLPEGRYREKTLARIEEVGAKRRKDSVVLQDAFVSASPDWIRQKPIEEQRKYFEHVFDFFCDRFGKDNILSAVIHMDEATPHMHLVFVPITSEGRLSSKTIIGGPKGMEKLQDDFHAHMVREYPDLTRGISKKITHRKHISPQMYKQAAVLYQHYEEILGAINAIGMVGNAKQKEEAVQLLGKYAPELATVKQQLASTEKYIRVLEERIAGSERIIAGKNGQLEEKDLALYEERAKVNQLMHKQKQLVGILDLVPKDMLKQLMEEKKVKGRSGR